MATIGQVYYNIMDNSSGNYISGDIDIFQDIVSGYGAKQFNKLGIQAPPGTRIVMNNSKTIMVGRTGIYELDEDITITNMYFLRPKKYIKDEAASEKAKQDGIAKMLEANTTRQQALDQLNEDFPTIPTDEDNPNYKTYWNRYNTIQSNYITSYQEGLSQFNIGSNGIYVLPNPDNLEADENYEDLYNVLIDFIYS